MLYNMKITTKTYNKLNNKYYEKKKTDHNDHRILNARENKYVFTVDLKAEIEGVSLIWRGRLSQSFGPVVTMAWSPRLV